VSTETTEREQVPLPAESGVSGQGPGSAVAAAEKTPLAKLSVGTDIAGLASTHASLFGDFGSDVFSKLGRAYDEISRLRVENAVQKTELKNLRANRRLAKFLLVLGPSMVAFGMRHTDQPEMGWPIVGFGVAVIIVGWLLGPRGNAS
jgi:hypothetical protein